VAFGACACATSRGPTGWRVFPTLRKRQGLKPIFSRSFAACLKPCPDTRLPTWAEWLKPDAVHLARLLLRGAGSQPADSTLVSSLALGPPPSVEKSLRAPDVHPRCGAARENRLTHDRPVVADGQAKACPTTKDIGPVGGACFRGTCRINARNGPASSLESVRRPFAALGRHQINAERGFAALWHTPLLCWLPPPRCRSPIRCLSGYRRALRLRRSGPA
jgi:hypothetical protein